MLLRNGSISQEVIKWQQFLAKQGFSVKSFDGIFGPETEKATKQWQGKNGLKADGIVGKASFTKAATQGYAYSAPYYPPMPDFGSPGPAARKAMFGSFEWKPNGPSSITILGDWTKNNIGTVTIPQLAGVFGAPKDGKILFHKKGMKAIKGFFKEVEDEGLKDLVISWAGSFVPRRIRGRNALSNHAWGTAFDINAPENWLNQEPAAVGKKGSLLKLVPIANKHGFFWGGHYRSRKDGMYFELAKI